MKKIVLAGGTGNLGTMLIRLFREQNYEIVVLSRQKMVKHHPKVEFVQWDAENLGDWQEKLNGADVLINLCGLSINRRFTEKNKKTIKIIQNYTNKIVGKSYIKSERSSETVD
jgi:NAD dependent epimerase/dehydratase family enzyme